MPKQNLSLLDFSADLWRKRNSEARQREGELTRLCARLASHIRGPLSRDQVQFLGSQSQILGRLSRGEIDYNAFLDRGQDSPAQDSPPSLMTFTKRRFHSHWQDAEDQQFKERPELWDADIVWNLVAEKLHRPLHLTVAEPDEGSYGLESLFEIALANFCEGLASATGHGGDRFSDKVERLDESGFILELVEAIWKELPERAERLGGIPEPAELCVFPGRANQSKGVEAEDDGHLAKTDDAESAVKDKPTLCPNGRAADHALLAPRIMRDASAPTIKLSRFASKMGKTKRTVEKVMANTDGSPSPYIRAQKRGQAHEYAWDEMRALGNQHWDKDIGDPPEGDSKNTPSAPPKSAK